MKVRSWFEQLVARCVNRVIGLFRARPSISFVSAGVLFALAWTISASAVMGAAADPAQGFKAKALARLRQLASGGQSSETSKVLSSVEADAASAAEGKIGSPVAEETEPPSAVEVGLKNQFPGDESRQSGRPLSVRPSPAVPRLGLAECVAMAISRNAEVEGVATRLEAARLRARSTRIRKHPRPGASASTRRGAGASLDSVSVSIDFDIDHDGMVEDEAKALELESANLEHSDLAARIRVADAVTGLYLDALTALATARVAKGALDSAASFLDRMQKSFDLKVVTPLDLLQAKSYHAAEIYRRDLAAAGVRKTAGALNTVLGLPYGQSVEFLEIIGPTDLPSLEDSRGLLALALKNRSDVKQARNLLAINRLRLSAAEKAGRTRVSFFGGSNWNGMDGDLERGPWNAGFRGSDDTWNGSFSFEASRTGSPGGTVFPGAGGEETDLTLRYVHNTGLDREIAVSVAKAELRRQELSLRDLRDGILEGINSLVLDIEVERARERSLAVNLEAKTEEKRKKSKEFDLGLETAEQLLDVSSELVSAETDLTLARYRILRKLYMLVRELYAFERSWLFREGKSN